MTLVAIVTALTLQYGLYGLFRHWRLGSGAYDLAIFDQAVWHLSRFEAPASTISGFENIWGDHFSPVLALLAPLYWIWPGPESLIVAQALLLAASAVPVYFLARESLGPGSGAAMAFAYGQYWGLQRAAAFDFHELAFAPVLIATALWSYRRARFVAMSACLVLLALVKEDMFAVCAGIGVLAAMQGRPLRGLIIGAAAVGGFLLVVFTVIPSFNAAGGYAYDGAIPDLTKPLSLLRSLASPPAKFYTMLLWLAPFLFLPLASPLVALVVALALSRLLSTGPNHWGPAFHYSAPMAPLVAVAAVDALRRLGVGHGPPWRRRAVVGAITLLCLFLPGNQPLWDLFRARHYRSTPASRTAVAALAVIPAAASVVAQDAVAPHVSRRREIHLLRAGAPDADFVLLLDRYSAWPNASDRDVEQLVAKYRAGRYETVFSRDGWTILSRPRRGE